MHSLLSWLTQYGYGGLFCLLVLGIVGAPVPDETLLVFCGYLAYTGRLQFGWTLIAGVCGAICGISISYLLGLRFGRRLMHQAGKYLRLTPEHLEHAEALFTRIGPVLLTIGYFIPGIRHFTALVAGMTGLRFGRFALFAYAGAAVWVCTFVTLGFVFADRWEHTSEIVHRVSIIAVGAAAVIFVCWWLLRRRRAI